MKISNMKPLNIVFNDNESYKVSIHQKHLSALAKEIYKGLSDINLDFLKPHFIIKEMP